MVQVQDGRDLLFLPLLLPSLGGSLTLVELFVASSLGSGRFMHLVVLYGYQGADVHAEQLAFV